MEIISDLVIDLEGKGAERDRLAEELKAIQVDLTNKMNQLEEEISAGKSKLAAAIAESPLPDIGVVRLSDGRLMRYKINNPEKGAGTPVLIACERLEVFDLGVSDEEE